MSAPEHHRRCSETSCVGIEGGCLRAAYDLGAHDEHAKNARLRAVARDLCTLATEARSALDVTRQKRASRSCPPNDPRLGHTDTPPGVY